MEKISAVYKIVNEVTGDSYVGSSKDVGRRWKEHKKPSIWKQNPNKPLYLDMQKYGVDKFRFQVLAPVMTECLKQVEQEFIELLHPTYNNANAKGLNVKRSKERQKKWRQSERGKERDRKYRQSERGKEVVLKSSLKYYHRMCSYNGEALTLSALAARFYRAGIEHYTQEAKKYLIGDDK